MKLYKITLRSRWGEPYIVTVPGRSIEEVLLKIVLDPGWIVGEYSIVY